MRFFNSFRQIKVLSALLPLLLLLATPCQSKSLPATPSNSFTGDSARHIGFAAGIQPGKAIVTDTYLKMFMREKKSFSAYAEMTLQTLPKDSDNFARDYNYPYFSFGLKHSVNNVTMHRTADPAWGMAEMVDYDSKVGGITTLYGTFTRPLYRSRHISFDYSLGMGVGYAPNKYNPHDNIDNEIIGAHWLIYFTAGAHANYHITPNWAIGAGVDFFHHSDGAMNRPNKGLNIFSPTVQVRYIPTPVEPKQRAANKLQAQREHREKYPYLFSNITVGVGCKTLDEEWKKTQFQTPPDNPNYRTEHFHHYTAYSLQADLMVRYARRWASGIGADLFYGSYYKAVEEYNVGNGHNERVSPWSVALAAKHNIYYHNIVVNSSIGYYLYRNMGYAAKNVEKPYYERIGVSYSFKQLHNIALGFSVKAHLGKADFTEILLYIPVWKGKRLGSNLAF